VTGANGSGLAVEAVPEVGAEVSHG
jgi:hypothetical protein